MSCFLNLSAIRVT